MAKQNADEAAPKSNFLTKALDWIERNGNKLPDPAILFLILMLLVWVFSAILSPIDFGETDPRSGNPLNIINLLTGEKLALWMTSMIRVFMNFAPLGVVLVAMLGVGVAEHSGYINAGLKKLLSF